MFDTRRWDVLFHLRVSKENSYEKRNYFVMPLMFLFFTMGWEDKKVFSFAWGGPQSGAVEY
jgi:hypothetical protein